jgi:hypothetical protein
MTQVPNGAEQVRAARVVGSPASYVEAIGIEAEFVSVCVMVTILPGPISPSFWAVAEEPPATTPGVPVAEKVSGEPVSPVLVAVSVLPPGIGPRVQLPIVAIPLALVVWVAPVTLPPPEATAKVTVIPATGLLRASRTRTLGAIGTADPAGAVWLLPAWTAI